MKKHNNELIAEFMKISEVTQYFDSYGIKKPIYWTEANNFRTRTYDLPDMSLKDFISESKYHESWDWLMPVVKKAFDCEFGDRFDEWKELNNKICVCLASVSIEGVYEALIEFIKWFNSQKS